MLSTLITVEIEPVSLASESRDRTTSPFSLIHNHNHSVLDKSHIKRLLARERPLLFNSNLEKSALRVGRSKMLMPTTYKSINKIYRKKTDLKPLKVMLHLLKCSNFRSDSFEILFKSNTIVWNLVSSWTTILASNLTVFSQISAPVRISAPIFGLF